MNWKTDFFWLLIGITAILFFIFGLCLGEWAGERQKEWAQGPKPQIIHVTVEHIR